MCAAFAWSKEAGYSSGAGAVNGADGVRGVWRFELGLVALIPWLAKTWAMTADAAGLGLAAKDIVG